eukprot:TRINITY_DN7548_c0_g1_i1.p1 TRINITY_DN7548_c0_g1~~TRINITY_DN7548_c0_g1_i1.p1  ORF type:complete len:401 (-),score=115.15 TRINITY_DN7548_c0_g1_i1:148-1311(-)
MGIHGLTKLIADAAPTALKENEPTNYFGRKIAIDASMALYSFLIAVRPDAGAMLTNQQGETTSHLLGMFYRTIKLITNGIKPVFVFDGKPPTLKSGELAKRSKKAQEAKEDLKEAEETGNTEDIEKFSKRIVRVTKQHNEETKTLLRLMGVPVVEAPCEAEAQCAAMAKAGVVFATSTEDMDSLTLGTPILLRHLTSAESKKLPILEIHLEKVLSGLGLTMDQFIDLCILCGCDYCDSIKGIGAKRAIDLIKKHGSLEKILDSLDKTKYPLPERFPYDEVRELFRTPCVTDPKELDLKWTDPDEEGLKKFLVEEKGFNEERVMNGIAKLKKSKSTSVQGRLDGFFTVEKTIVSTTNKRKKEDEKEKGSKKAKTVAGKIKTKPSKGKK